MEKKVKIRKRMKRCENALRICMILVCFLMLLLLYLGFDASCYKEINSFCINCIITFSIGVIAIVALVALAWMLSRKIRSLKNILFIMFLNEDANARLQRLIEEEVNFF